MGPSSLRGALSPREQSSGGELDDGTTKRGELMVVLLRLFSSSFCVSVYTES
jgi:hypothetical protein